MLYYSDSLDVEAIAFYHKTRERQAMIRQNPGFDELKSDIAARGILHPVLCIKLPGEIRIEVGEQRLLIANDLGIKTISGFIRSDTEQKGFRIVTDKNQVMEIFNGVDCPTFNTICDYIESGVIKCS